MSDATDKPMVFEAEDGGDSARQQTTMTPFDAILDYAMTTGRIEQHRGTGRWLCVRFPLHDGDQFDTYRMSVLARLEHLKAEAHELERDRTNNYRLGLEPAEDDSEEESQ